MPSKPRLLLPVVTLGAEHLVMAMLMRRNLLAYKAPPNQAGYDLICIHPDPKHSGTAARVQVKCRYATDASWSIPASKSAADSYDFLVFVRMNIGYFYSSNSPQENASAPELYVIPRNVAVNFYRGAKTSKLVFPKSHLGIYKDTDGIELIALFLNVDKPSRAAVTSQEAGAEPFQSTRSGIGPL